MGLPSHKTKIVCTIGPASESPEVMERLILAGMDVARLNFSHGDFAAHARVIGDLRRASRRTGRRVAILADLPGPKMRIGAVAGEPVELRAGQTFVLTSEPIVGSAERVSTTFEPLPRVVGPGDTLFLNDGVIQLEVTAVEGVSVTCVVRVGGELRSRKGLNLPGVRLGLSAFTDHDRACLEFALAQGVDAVSQSFVETGDDVRAVRRAAEALGHRPFLVAKIERAGALSHVEDILEAADAIMVARGDLGVEIPIERIASTQKRLARQANLAGKPVITATQMLESMTSSRRPTRAEATDVANAILDGTDCVMLSGESAVGRYPVEAVEMLAAIAADIEGRRPHLSSRELPGDRASAEGRSLSGLVALSVVGVLERVTPAAVFVPTFSGKTARDVCRFRLPVWIAAVSPSEATCQALQFSYGVRPVFEPDTPSDWKPYVRRWLDAEGVKGDMVVLTEGPSPKNPEANHRMELLDLRSFSS